MRVFCTADEWWPVYGLERAKEGDLGTPMEVPDELWAEWVEVSSRFDALQVKLRDLEQGVPGL